MSSPPQQNLNKDLTDFLEIIDNHLKNKIILVAAGGTAMTLLDLKSSTIDIDFTGPQKDIEEFRTICNSIPHGKKIDTWFDGVVFSQFLPEDYIKKSIAIKTSLKNIDLRALHPVDIIVTKIGRLNSRDKEDIRMCIRRYSLSRDNIKERAKYVKENLPGNKLIYEENLKFLDL